LGFHSYLTTLFLVVFWECNQLRSLAASGVGPDSAKEIRKGQPVPLAARGASVGAGGWLECCRRAKKAIIANG
jgi:hypothetical protein